MSPPTELSLITGSMVFVHTAQASNMPSGLLPSQLQAPSPLGLLLLPGLLDGATQPPLTTFSSLSHDAVAAPFAFSFLIEITTSLEQIAYTVFSVPYPPHVQPSFFSGALCWYVLKSYLSLSVA